MAPHRSLTLPDGDAYTLADASVPAAFLPPGTAPADEDGIARVDIDIARGRVEAVRPASARAPDRPVVGLDGRLVFAALVDMHTHLDKGQAWPRARADGTIATGANGTAADRIHWTEEDIARRIAFGLRCAEAHGVSAIRTHLDSNHELTARVWSVFDGLKASWRDRVLLQGVGLAPLDMFLSEAGRALADRVAQSEGVLGGVTDGIGGDWADTSQLDAALDAILRLAAERGLDVDLHVDQSDDISAFALPRVAEAVLRNRFQRRVVCGHCVNLALQPEKVAARTLDLCRQAGLAFVSLPTPMMYLMDRRPGRTPRWRGVTLVQELRDAGLAVAIGGDNCRDAWFPYGDHDMVDTLQQAVRVLQLDHPIAATPAMAGPVPAEIIGAAGHGRILPGQPARLILFAARNLNEFMCRPQADRIVISRGLRLELPLPDYAEL